MGQTQITHISIEKLIPHPENPRKNIGDVSELADSIRAKGVLQNLTVVPVDPADPDTCYTVIIGHRRLAAAKQAGLSSLPCVISDMSYQEQIETMLLENMQRNDLTVYEQAMGFQQLSMLGADVAEIADKTGFSQTTVRRRLKIAELDHDTLKEVSARQVSIGDFDRLNEIDDPAKRNEVLKKIGTNDFNFAVNAAVREQAEARCKKEAAPILRRYHIHKMEGGEQYSQKWKQIKQIEYTDWKPELLDKYAKGDYGYAFSYAHLDIYEKQKTVKAPPRPQAEIDREKYIAETREKLEAIAANAYALRKDFVDGLRMTEKNMGGMIRGAYYAILYAAVSYSGNSVRDMLTPDGSYLSSDQIFDAAETKFADRSTAVPAMIYAGWNDSKEKICWGSYRREFPKFQRNKALDKLYEWLVLEFNYELSDEELQMISGTHPLYMDKDKPADAPAEEEWADGAGQAFSPDADDDLDRLKEMYGEADDGEVSDEE